MRSTARRLAQQPFLLFHLVAATFVWVFVWRHAVMLNLTYDEAASFHNLKIGHYRALPGVANTHWLNSLFIRLIMTFNESVLCLRLQSIIAFPFFAHGIYRLAKYIKSGGAQIAFYCLIVFNPYVIDFFSLARGYGMAMTFQAWTILFFIKAVNADFNYRLWMQIFLLSALTLGANLSYQYTIMAITGGYLLYCIITDSPFSWYTNKQKRRITLLFVMLLFFTTLDLLFIKYYGKDLEFGGRNNFLRSLFDAFWIKSLYKASYTSLSIWLSWGTLVLIGTATIYFIRRAIQQKQLNTGIIAAFITGSIFLLVIIFHVVFNTPYLTNRTALQWYVPALFVIFLALGEWQLPVKGSRFASLGLGMATGLLVLFHFVTTNNGTRCMEYDWEDPSRQPLYDLYALHPKHPGISIWIAGVYIDYYSLVDSLTPPAAVFAEYPNNPLDSEAIQTLHKSDYIISHTPVTPRFLDSTHIPYRVIKTYEDSDYKIIKVYH